MPRGPTVGCISSERHGKHTTWWLDRQIVPRAAVADALESAPPSRDQARRYKHEERASLVLFLVGMGGALTTMAGLVGWISHDPNADNLWAVVVPFTLSYGLVGTGVGLGLHSSAHWNRAVDSYNEAASAAGRCPP